MSQEFNPSASVSDGRAAPGGNGGGTGAPPSNTAPDSCNPECTPLRWGIDSLYLSYPGTLAEHRDAELRKLKALAQSAPHDAAKAQMALGDHVFEVRDKSSGLFAFTLADGAFMIRLSSHGAKRVPMAYVQVSSGLLSYKSILEIERELQGILEALGDIERPSVSRVDLFVDFCSCVDMESWDRRAWITKASAVHQYAEDKAFTGWTIGAGGVVMARLYHKLIESRKSGKEYLHRLWEAAGWDGERAVWRLEFEFKREVLSQLGLDGIASVLSSRPGLWSYATTEWLKLCVPNPTDETRSRWPIHPLWVALASVDWGRDGGPMLRSYKPLRAPSMEYLGSRALAAFSSVAALTDTFDFNTAVGRTAEAAWSQLARQDGLNYVGADQLFREKVEGLVRRYNVRMNVPPDDTPEPEEPLYRNPYFRGKQGL